MRDEELLLSISKMLDDKISPLEKRMDSMEKDLKEEIGIVRNEVKLVKDEVKLVKDELTLVDNKVHLINLKLENVFEPRMNTIEACYLDTYKRYQNGVDRIDRHEKDNELIRSILQKHSKILQTQTA